MSQGTEAPAPERDPRDDDYARWRERMLRPERPATPFEGEPPVNLEAEQALLGALLAHNPAYERIAGKVTADDFADGAHQRIFSRAEALITRGRPANAVTLKRSFERDEGLVEVGGAQYLARLQAMSIAGISIVDYARAVADLSLRRRLLDFSWELAQDAHSDLAFGDSAIDLANAAQAKLAEIGIKAAKAEDSGPRSLASIGEDALGKIETAIQRRQSGKLAGLGTGLPLLDEKLSGLQGGDLILLGGRPSMGKTSLAENLAWYAARQKEPVFFASAEMPADQLVMREVARELSCPLDVIRSGKLGPKGFGEATDVIRDLRALPLRIDDRGSKRPASIISHARHLKRTSGLSLLVVDYLQLLHPLIPRRHNRNQELADITAAFKELALDLAIPVILLSQLSRAVTERDNHRPTLGDLRDSGAIEQDADVVLFVHREAWYIEKDEPAQKSSESAEKYAERYAMWQQRMAKAEGLGEIIVDKHRQGTTGALKMLWHGVGMRWEDPAPARLTKAEAAQAEAESLPLSKME